MLSQIRSLERQIEELKPEMSALGKNNATITQAAQKFIKKWGEERGTGDA
jgi:prefoldin subunit 5